MRHPGKHMPLLAITMGDPVVRTSKMKLYLIN
jgi:hypothetical protein